MLYIPGNIFIEKIRQLFKRRVQDSEPAVLGDGAGAGRCEVEDRKGYYYVRFYDGKDAAGNDLFSPPTTARATNAAFQVYEGSPVYVAYGRNNELQIVEGSYEALDRAGIDTRTLNPFHPQSRWVYLWQITIGLATATATPTTASFLVSVKKHLTYVNNVFRYFETGEAADKFDFTAYNPAADQHRYAIVWQDVYGEVGEITASASQSLFMPLSIEDINEATAQRPPDAIPYKAFVLANAGGTLTQSVTEIDLRQFLNTPHVWGFPNPVAYRERIHPDRQVVFAGSLVVTGSLQVLGSLVGVPTVSGSGGGSSGITQLTGDATAGPGNGSQALTLATVNGASGTTRNTRLTTNPKGLVTFNEDGPNIKPAVRLATAAALPAVTYANGTGGVGATLTENANGALTVDGVAAAVNDRILVKNQSSGLQNGIYIVTDAGSAGTVFVLTRDSDSDASAEILKTVVFVHEGTANANSWYACTNASAVTVGTTAITFVGGLAINANAVTSLTGDVTGTGPGATATTIAAGAVSASKIAEAATPMVNNFRLSAQNVDDSEADVSAAGDLYLVSANGGNRITLHDGSRWLIVTPTNATITGDLSLSLSPITISHTNGSNIITTSAPYDQRLLCIGMQATTVPVAAGTPLITAFTSTTTLTVSINSNATASGVAANFKLQEDIRFDVFAYLTGTSQDVALHFEQWTNNTTRAFALAQTDRRWHLTGDAKMLYVGSARTRAGAVNVNDTVLQRHLWNYYNQRLRVLRLISGINTINDTNTTIHQFNSSTVQQVEVMIGMANLSTANLKVLAYPNTGGMRAAVGYDSTTTFDAPNLGYTGAVAPFVTSWDKLMPDIGNHILSMNARGIAAGQWFGQNSNIENGMSGSIWM